MENGYPNALQGKISHPELSCLLAFQHVPPTAPNFQPKEFLDTSGADTLPSYRAPPDLQGIQKRVLIASLQSAD